jgi:leucyl/phenylalanyl-tRNA---protein transferase
VSKPATMSNEYYHLEHGDVIVLKSNCDFPQLDAALTEPNGLIAIGGELSTERLLNAYANGIFPWYNQGEPILWWSPNPRMVLFPDELKVSRSLKKTLAQSLFKITKNTAFTQVMQACAKTARPDQDGTWIQNEMIAAYSQLHQLGYAHSIEAWQDKQLVGGCYGIKIGHMFFGESMFHHVNNASKVAFVHLVEWLKTEQVAMIDCQMKTPLLSSFGGREISRELFKKNLDRLIAT